MADKNLESNPVIDAMFKVGAHFGYSKSRRHPSVKPYIFGAKNKVEIFDLDKTKDLLHEAKQFVSAVAKEHGVIVFASSKNEAREAIRKAGQELNLPYVAGRWIGGTLSNFAEIRKRIDRMETLTSQREKGELGKYTKKERLLIDREIAKLERFFSGLASLKSMPKALFIVDPDKEDIAVKEAIAKGVPVIALASSDCDIKKVEYPIVGNDSSKASINYFVSEIISAYNAGKKSAEIK